MAMSQIHSRRSQSRWGQICRPVRPSRLLRVPASGISALTNHCLIARRSAEPLHQARVAIRRLRSALSLFEPVVTDKEYKRLKRRLRDVSHQFGEARDLDVYIAHIRGADVNKGGQLPAFAIEARRASPSRARARLWARDQYTSVEALSPIYARPRRLDSGRPMAYFGRAGEQTARDQNIEEFAACAFKRRRRKLKRHGRHLERLSPEERHRIRIEAKKLRYASEFFSELFAGRKHRKRYRAFIAALGDLKARLGDLNDIQNEQEIAAELISHKATSASRSRARHAAARHLGDQNKRNAAVLISACEAHQRFLDARPFWR